VTGVAATRIDRQSTGWRLVTEESGQGRSGDVLARDVLVATNGYTDRAAPALRRRLVPIGSYIIATEPLAAELAAAILPRRRMAFDTKNFVHYFRVTEDRRLLFGGRAEFARPDAAATRRAAAILQRGMTRIFPDLARARIDYAWGGNVAFARDQLPHAGRLGGLCYAGGYAGHGIAMATYLGGLVARRLAGQRIDNPLFDRPAPAIPLYRGTPWFLPLVGAYYRFLDLVG
jgi:glycine/D-amino acid oxidase-like deaminating enzyme